MFAGSEHCCAFHWKCKSCAGSSHCISSPQLHSQTLPSPFEARSPQHVWPLASSGSNGNLKLSKQSTTASDNFFPFPFPFILQQLPHGDSGSPHSVLMLTVTAEPCQTFRPANTSVS